MSQRSDEDETRPVRIVAGWIRRRSGAFDKRCIPWFSPKAYSRLRAALKDPADFPPDYDEWRKLGEAEERQWIERGATVLRGGVNPEAFMAWSKKHFVKPNRKAVELFVEEMIFGGESCAPRPWKWVADDYKQPATREGLRLSHDAEVLAPGLRPLLADIRKAQADATSDIRKTVSFERLDRWAEAIEAALQNAGQGQFGSGTISLEELNSSND